MGRHRHLGYSLKVILYFGKPHRGAMVFRGDKVLRQGDVVNIDVTPILDGWHGDLSRMYPVGKIEGKAQRLIDVTYTFR